MSTPGPITKLQRSFAYRLSQRFPSEMLRWMDLVSKLVDTLSPFGVQSGIATLTNGVSDPIPANIRSTTHIAFGMRTVSGAFGTPVVTILVAGTPGSFTFASSKPADGSVVTTDQGTYFWIAVG